MADRPVCLLLEEHGLREPLIVKNRELSSENLADYSLEDANLSNLFQFTPAQQEESFVLTVNRQRSKRSVVAGQSKGSLDGGGLTDVEHGPTISSTRLATDEGSAIARPWALGSEDARLV